jgi:protease-4
VTRVAHGRGLTYEQVDSVAQGRTWLGDDAVARRLVDEIGGLERSIAEARRRGGVPEGEEIRIAEYRRPRPGLFSRLIGSYVSQVWERTVGLPRAGAIYDWADEPVE